MTPTPEELTQLVVLRFLYKKKVLASSYTLNQLFAAVKIYTLSVPQVLADLEAAGLIQHAGAFDATSGLLKNISLTAKGVAVAEAATIAPHVQALSKEFEGFSKYQELFA